MLNRFESLPIFQDAHALVLFVYTLTKTFPDDERFGLTSQLRRSVSSVPANIIEGNSRNHKKGYLEFLYIAKGSLEETKYHLLLAKDLQYIEPDDYVKAFQLAENVGKQITGLIHYVRKSIKDEV